MSVTLNELLFAKLAGWDVIKQARTLLASGAVLRSEWEPPRLTGQVRDGGSTLTTGLVIRSALDADNLCLCRTSRQRGVICAHAVAVGLHHLRGVSAPDSVSPATEHAPCTHPVVQVPRRIATKVLQRAGPGANGEPLELGVILPPNLVEALSRGQLMVVLEGCGRRGRTPLNALPLDVPYALSAQDAALLDFLERLNEGNTPAMMRLEGEPIRDLLRLLAQHPRVTAGRHQTVTVSGEPLPVALRALLQPDGEIVLSLASAVPVGVIHGPTPWVATASTLQPLGLEPGLESLLKGPLRFPRSRVPLFLNVEWPRLAARGSCEANFALQDFTLETARPQFALHVAGGLAVLQAKLECSYNGRPVTALPDDVPWFPDPQSPIRYFARDPEAERAAVARLLRAGFTAADSQGWHHLKGQDPVLRFFARDFPLLEKSWHVTLEERLQRSTRDKLERIEPSFRITSSGSRWFDVNVSYETRGGERFTAADIQQLLRGGQSHTRLRNGKFALLDTGAVEELQEVLVDCAPQQHAGGYRFDHTQAGFLDATLREQGRWQVHAPASWTERAALQRGTVSIHPPSLGHLEPVLRPYQKDGVGWLGFLRVNGFGGILADEMGLGKTLQVLAHLSTRKAAPGGFADPGSPPRPAMVVCPTSLVFNWAAEAARFTPGLRVLTLHGPQRHQRWADVESSDLVLTSYALLRRDAEHYRTREFDTVVLDEAQHIKNRQTQNAQSVKAIRARHRLVLTGTPLENSVLDLWSIFDFLMPGYLGSAADFRERYEQPLVRDREAAVQSRLARRLRPFVLRRLKRDVAADLPERIEQVSLCDLTDEQRAVYQQVLDATRRELGDAKEPGSLARGRMLVLTALLRLRQICCDLRLLPAVPTAPASPESTARDAAATPAPSPTSGKVEMFGELLEEVLDGGHRVLVFSQFTRMLGLLREDLITRGIPFCYLDGDTRNRAEVVQTFQQDSGIPVFLISLKAGGVGLNLTGADTVVHFDPWWNPAVEAQATDRAHRIGQKRVVTSYKLITRGTVEEKILHLQARKRSLLQGMLGDEAMLTEALSWEEIQDLLAG